MLVGGRIPRVPFPVLLLALEPSQSTLLKRMVTKDTMGATARLLYRTQALHIDARTPVETHRSYLILIITASSKCERAGFLAPSRSKQSKSF